MLDAANGSCKEDRIQLYEGYTHRICIKFGGFTSATKHLRTKPLSHGLTSLPAQRTASTTSMGITAVDTTLPVEQSPPHHEIGPQNEHANHQPIQPTKKQFLDETMEFLKKEKTMVDKASKSKTKKGTTTKEYLEMSDQLDPSKSKYKDLHELERCLKLLHEHEQLLKAQERTAELMFKNDLHEQYHYEPYFEVVKKLKTFIAKKKLSLLPEFNVVDPQSKTKQAPELYGNKCKDIMKNLFDQRYAFVKPYLSSYHQTLIERNNNSTLYNLMRKREQIALTRKLDFEYSTRLSSLSIVSNPILPTNLSPKCVECGNPVREEAIPPTSNVTGTRKRDSTNVADTPSNTSRKRRRTEVHPAEGEQEITAVPRLTIPPSPSQAIPNFSLQESMTKHNQHHDENNNTSHLGTLNPVLKQTIHHVWDATKSHPSNNSIDQSNETPVSADHLQNDMLQTLYSNCNDDVSCLIASVGNGASGSRKGLFTRACESAMKRECTQGVPCKSYRNAVDNMCDWVVQDQNEVEIVSLVTQLETHELYGEPNMTQNARIEYYAKNAANDKMAIWQYRATIVGELLSPIDHQWLRKIIQKAKITFKQRAMIEMLKHVRQEGLGVNSTSLTFGDVDDRFSMNDDILEKYFLMS